MQSIKEINIYAPNDHIALQPTKHYINALAEDEVIIISLYSN